MTEELRRFLNGEAPLEGVWFGETHPTKRGAFWWREYLAEPEQEPVATVAEVHMSRYTIEWTNGPLPQGTALYTAPTPRRPLTRSEVRGLIESAGYENASAAEIDAFISGARHAEAAHGITGEQT